MTISYYTSFFFCFNSTFSYFYRPASCTYRKEPCKQQGEADDTGERVKLPNKSWNKSSEKQRFLSSKFMQLQQTSVKGMEEKRSNIK